MGMIKDKMIEIRKEDAMKMLEQYGINELSDPKLTQAVLSIISDLAEGNYINSSTSPMLITNAYLHAIMEQNLIIIELLDKIANKS